MFCVKTYNLQNTAIKVIIHKMELHFRSSLTEVYLIWTISDKPESHAHFIEKHPQHLQGGATQQQWRQINLGCCTKNTHNL